MINEALIEHPLWLEKLSADRQQLLDKSWLVFSPKGLAYIREKIAQGKVEIEPSILLYEDPYIPNNRVYGILNRQQVSYELVYDGDWV